MPRTSANTISPAWPQTDARCANKARTGPGLRIFLKACTVLKGTAAADRLPGANRGWCEPGGQAQRTRSPRSRRKNRPGSQTAHRGPSRPGRRNPRAGRPRRTHQRQLTGTETTAKEGGTAGPPQRAGSRPSGNVISVLAGGTTSCRRHLTCPRTHHGSPRCPRRSTCPRSSVRSWAAGKPRTSSSTRSSRPKAASPGRSTRDRPPPTACPACTTSRPGCSRTCSPGSRPCRASTCSARPAGTATGCRSRWRSSVSWGSPARRTSRPTASPSSTSGAGSPCSGTWTRSPR